ncbi:MAG: hypothetical protein LBU62_00335 [Bacteroidales bacterium]|nr:hypothetical protein [Bacteroidales bacterium]
MSRRWNNIWIGLALGVALPLLVFAGIYAVKFSHLTFNDFLSYTHFNKTLSKMLSLCVFPNLLVFYLVLNKEFWKATRGVIGATLLWTFVILCVKFFI